MLNLIDAFRRTVSRQQLVASGGLTHAMAMPNVTEDLPDRCAADCLNWSKWTPA